MRGLSIRLQGVMDAQVELVAPVELALRALQVEPLARAGQAYSPSQQDHESGSKRQLCRLGQGSLSLRQAHTSFP